jgi:hypothetical protein
MKTTFITASVSAVALFSGLAIGYHRGYYHGYARGSSDELSRWRIQSISKEPFPNTTMIGKRELWVNSDGTKVPPPRIVHDTTQTHEDINNIPVTVFQ